MLDERVARREDQEYKRGRVCRLAVVACQSRINSASQIMQCASRAPLAFWAAYFDLAHRMIAAWNSVSGVCLVALTDQIG